MGNHDQMAREQHPGMRSYDYKQYLPINFNKV